MKTAISEIDQFLRSEERAETRIYWCSRISLGIFATVLSLLPTLL